MKARKMMSSLFIGVLVISILAMMVLIVAMIRSLYLLLW